MSVTDAGIAARDAFVLRSCAEAAVPVAVAIGGGYCPDTAAIVERHVAVHRAAAEVCGKFVEGFVAGRQRLRRQRSEAAAAAPL